METGARSNARSSHTLDNILSSAMLRLAKQTLRVSLNAPKLSESFRIGCDAVLCLTIQCRALHPLLFHVHVHVCAALCCAVSSDPPRSASPPLLLSPCSGVRVDSNSKLDADHTMSLSAVRLHHLFFFFSFQTVARTYIQRLGPTCLARIGSTGFGHCDPGELNSLDSAYVQTVLTCSLFDVKRLSILSYRLPRSLSRLWSSHFVRKFGRSPVFGSA